MNQQISRLSTDIVIESFDNRYELISIEIEVKLFAIQGKFFKRFHEIHETNQIPLVTVYTTMTLVYPVIRWRYLQSRVK